MNKPKYVIVVGIDYSMASERALDEALTLASSKHGVHLHVVNVRGVVDEHATSVEAPAPPPPWRYWAAELREYVARKVAAFPGHRRRRALPARPHSPTHGRPGS
ncbi:MAG TPA: universal stress protein [Polyangiaceae bacterium]|nr:universal stress protein [Polyangiaceae bacterium]